MQGLVMNASNAAWTILGLGAVVALLTRGFWLIPDREVPIAPWLMHALKVAPLAAVAAVAALAAVAAVAALVAMAASLHYIWRPRVLGPVLAGLALYLPLRLLLGW